MADNRYVNTGFWRDTYVRTLTKEEKIVFLYLLTNPETNIAGIYEINPEQVALDTNIGGKSPKNGGKLVEKILQKLQSDDRLMYKNGWIALKNWTKHQRINPSIATGIQRVLDDVPEWFKIELGLEVEERQLPLGSIQPVHNVGTTSDLLNIIKYNIKAHTAQERGGSANDFSEKSNNTNNRNYKRSKSMKSMGELANLSRKELRERGIE